MSLSTRFARVGLSALVIGALAAIMPSTGTAYAVSAVDSKGCPTTLDNSSGTNGANIAAGVLGAGTIYAASSGLLAAGSNDKRKKGDKLDKFVYDNATGPK